MPTVPLASEVVVMLGAGVTTTVEVTDFVVSLAEVAMTVTVILAETVAGALKVAAVAVVFEKVPQAVPLHDVPDMLQVTPLPLVSLATVAVKFKLCP